MFELLVRHRPGGELARFEVCRKSLGGHRLTTTPNTDDFQVIGPPEGHLMGELRWYLEQYLEYPFPPESERAARVLEALTAWGKASYRSLFPGLGRGEVPERLRISSDDPRILSWPWEALHHPQAGPLGHATQIERCLEDVSTPFKASPQRFLDHFNILLITARSDDDIAYRSISRPLVEAIRQLGLPVRTHLLRPPSLAQLRRHLIDHADTFHVLHFDGHGTYERGTRNGPEGHLFFEEDETGQTVPIPGRTLAAILKDHPIPVVVLNACQSAMIDEKAENAFASVAASLLAAGSQSVVAMAYSLYLRGAQVFLEAFYRRLLESGNVSEAVKKGRLQMSRDPLRVCASGRFPLEDWLVPVLYQRNDAPLALPHLPPQIPASSRHRQEERKSPSHAAIGRERELLALERALRRSEPAIVIQGLGGIGKTTLARSLIKWLRDTGGLGEGCIWLSFHDIVSTHDLLHRIGEALSVSIPAPLEIDQRIRLVAESLRQRRFLMVWDNFELVASSPDPALPRVLSDEDRDRLLDLLRRLRGGESKVVVTSRGREDWLGTERSIIRLGGLRGEERWLYSERLMSAANIDVELLRDPSCTQLIEALNGHPLAMRVILPRLAQRSADALIDALDSNLEILESTDDAEHRQLFATLRFLEEALPDRLRPFLLPLALHAWFVDADCLKRMVLFEPARSSIDSLLEALVVAGLVRRVGNGVWELHPILTSFLRTYVLPKADVSTRDHWSKIFVKDMGSLIDQITGAPLHQQREIFRLHRANFLKALSEAERGQMPDYQIALLQGLGVHALLNEELSEARVYLKRLLAVHGEFSEEKDKAPVYHQLGTLAEIERDFAEAEEWTLKALSICESHGLEKEAATACHQLGLIAKRQRDFATAAEWYRRAYETETKLGHRPGIAMACHELGTVAEEGRDFAAAQDCFEQAAGIFEDVGSDDQAARTWHHMGNLAEAQRRFEDAERWYVKSARLSRKLGQELEAAKTYYQLSQVAQARGDLDAAESWSRNAIRVFESHGDAEGIAAAKLQFGRVSEEKNDLEIAEKWLKAALEEFERIGDNHGAANASHHLGRIAEKQGDLDRAEEWYRKSLEIEEHDANPKGAAQNYHQLAVVAVHRQRYFEAGQWLIRSIEAFYRCQDEVFARHAEKNFLRVYQQVPEAEKELLRAFWKECGLEG